MQTSQRIQLILVFLIFSTTSYSQFYKGKVVDKGNVGIGFAHVFFQNDQSRGSSTNDIGEFSILVREVNMIDTLVISVLGYKTVFIPYAEIENYKNVIKLSSSELMLSEITVLSDSYYRFIIKEAIAKIEVNYPNEDHLQRGYYQNYTISDTSYSEMIEADFQLFSNGYNDDKLKEDIYLNQLRKTEDNRNLPERLKNENNSIYNILRNNNIYRRTLSKFGALEDLKSINAFINSVDDISALQFHSQSIQEGDTVLTIKISDGVFMYSPIIQDGDTTHTLKMIDPANEIDMVNIVNFVLVSINLTDLAIVKLVFGSKWEMKEDFTEVVYRKIQNKYYPAYIRNVTGFEFDKKTKKHYSSHCILFYDLVLEKQNIKAYRKGSKMQRQKNLRRIKRKVDIVFWEQYPYRNQLPATTILRTKFNNFSYD